ncbi:uncharacterized protein LOC143845350 [Tasmannia lanceolata]|uniref:uncharacterized protein LOC143845350 n=1 Tax=Tasmannia lanceolata TaxID=3420 RepID=UPI004063CAEC
MLSRSFKPGKCKTSLKLAVARIKLLKNKREVQLRQMKRDLAHLLESGQEQTAMIRVEHVVREEKTMAAYDIIELYCELIVARLPIIESQKNCPMDLKEAISSVIFASPRCADIPELLDARKHFVAKYGKEFIAASLELRPESGVNRTIIEKLSAKAPDSETKIKILTAIAQEHNVKWDPGAPTEPAEDLLNGPSKFESASKTSLESPSAQFQPTPSQKHEPSTKFSDYDVTRSSPSSNTFPPVNTSTHTTSIPSTSRPEPRVSESRTEREEFGESFSRDENASSNRPNWNMEFKDATAAAQAAAESAERASLAARAAAVLSSRGKVTRPTGSELKIDRVEDLSKNYDSSRSSHIMKPRMQDQQRDEMESVERRSSRPHSSQSKIGPIDDDASLVDLQNMDNFSRKSSSDVETINLNYQSKNSEHGDFLGERSNKKQSSPSVSSHSSMGSFDDDISVVDFQNTDAFSRKSFSEVEDVHHNREEADLGLGSIQKQSSKSAYPHSSTSPINDEEISYSAGKYENDANNYFSVGTEQGKTQARTTQPSFSNNAVPLFDESASDSEGYLDLDSHDNEKESDSHFPTQGRNSPSRFSSNMDPWSPKEQRSGSLLRDSSSAPLHFVTEAHPPAEFPEVFTRGKNPSQTNDSFPVAFDDSDGLDSESEEELDNFKPRERAASSNLPSKQNVSTGSLSSSQSGGPSETYFKKKQAEDPQNIHSSKPSSAKDVRTKESFTEPSLPAYTKETEFSNDESHESGHELSNDSGWALNIGRLTGGLRNKGFSLPPYIKGPSGDTSLPSQQEKAGETPNIIEEPTVFPLEKTSARSNSRDQDSYSQKLHIKVHEELSSGDTSLPSQQQTTDGAPNVIEEPTVFPLEKTSARSNSHSQDSYSQKSHVIGHKELSSRRPKTYFDSDSDDGEELQPQPRQNVGKQESYNQKQHIKVQKELSSKSPITYFESDSDDDKEIQTRQVTGSKGLRGGMSRRARNSSSATQTGNRANLAPISSVAQPTKPLRQTEISIRKETVKSAEPSSAVEHPTLPKPKTLISGTNKSPKSSGGVSTSSENSVRSSSHVHPKLPDYDTLASHFESLRSNRR